MTILKNSNFISFFEKELWDLGQCMYDIDICRYHLQEQILISQKNRLIGNNILCKLYFLLSEHIILKLCHYLILKVSVIKQKHKII